jgi:hypothetical protein
VIRHLCCIMIYFWKVLGTFMERKCFTVLKFVLWMLFLCHVFQCLGLC